MTAVKICGITSVRDAHDACRAGADAIGLVFYDDSPRTVTIECAAAIVATLPEYVAPVGVFVNESAHKISNVLRHVPLKRLQFHGDELVTACEAYAMPYIKAIRLPCDVMQKTRLFAPRTRFLFDCGSDSMPGGGGTCFAWEQLPLSLARNNVIAGGLNNQNILACLQYFSPWGVDVSSGVESAPGIKSFSLMRDFIAQVRAYRP